MRMSEKRTTEIRRSQGPGVIFFLCTDKPEAKLFLNLKKQFVSLLFRRLNLIHMFEFSFKMLECFLAGKYTFIYHACKLYNKS